MQVSVLQYGGITTIDVPWNVAQQKEHLLSLVDLMQQEGGPSHIGNVDASGCGTSVVILILSTSDRVTWAVTLILGPSFLSCKARGWMLSQVSSRSHCVFL